MTAALDPAVPADDAAHPLDRRRFFQGAAALAAGSLSARTAPAQTTASTSSSPATTSLDTARDLDIFSSRALRWAGPYPANWVRPRSGVDHNVVIIGAGHSGLGIGYGLKRKGIGGVAIIDQADPGQAGIWRNIARMQQLRTPKTQPGPEGSNVMLGFRGWYETQHGPEAFDALDRVPRLQWADYLAWFQKATSMQVGYRTRLVEIEPAGDLLRLHLEADGAPRVETTRKVVLANGYAGAGGPSLPDYVRDVPRRLWTHSTGAIPFDSFKGKVIAVVGAGANAFDAAGVALESGAAEVHMFDRRSYVDYALAPPSAPRPASPPVDRGFGGVTEYNYDLPDLVRWRNFALGDTRPASVPYDSMMRAVKFSNFHLHLGTNLAEVRVVGSQLAARANDRAIRFDHLISGTGYRVDLGAQPELKNVYQSVALWRDRFTPPVGEENVAGAMHPYLGGGFEFQSRAGADAGVAACLRNVHCFNLAAELSYGILVGDIASMVYHPRLVAAIARDLYQDSLDIAVHERYIHAPLVAPDAAPYQSRV
jgi:cation diffusion facilitator CzcD-associated flavoprotein CzcO